MNIQHHFVPSARETARLGTEEPCSGFLVSDLFAPGEARFALTDLDRAFVGGVCPQAGSPLKLETPAALRSEYLCERRELGVFNLGGAGTVVVDGETFSFAPRECLYIGRDGREIEFSSDSHETSATFYLVSYPAHASYPTRKAQANVVRLGNTQEANERSLHQFIHEKGVQSCQLVMGFTEFAAGSVWNTMPPHTHLRRSEVYCFSMCPTRTPFCTSWASCRKRAPGFDFLVNNAGTGIHAPFTETSEEQFDEMVNIHFKGVFFLTQKLLPLMNDGGRILNISSGLARFSYDNYSAYGACKGAVETLSRYLAKELGPRGITVNVVAPGAIETDFGGGVVRDNEQLNKMVASQTALGRVGLPDDIGGVVASLLSDEMHWVNGQRIEVAGGIHL